MRYPKDHKGKTRQKIVETAAREFREKGIEGVGVADLMRAAGLTHGGFYAHFDSKEALVAEACRHAIEATVQMLAFRASQAAPGDALRTIARSYVSRSHRDDAARGCILPSLAGDIARRDGAARGAVTAELARLADTIAAHVQATDAGEARRRALAIVSGMVGAIALARAVDDRALSDDILAGARDLVLDAGSVRSGG